jgi:nitrate reductase NapE component
VPRNPALGLNPWDSRLELACLGVTHLLNWKRSTLKNRRDMKENTSAFAWVLTVFLTTCISPLLSTALADGGKPTIVPMLQAVITNPTPAVNDEFGFPIAVVGSDRVLIGARFDDTGATDSGAAYLFGTNGAVITTFTNPTPANNDLFGFSLAAVGSDFVLIGTGISGAGTGAYLFQTNGSLVRTFTDPTPSMFRVFGRPLAALGTDRVLIGMLQEGSGSNFGAVYLYSTNGALLNTFTNPVPTANDFFGTDLVAVGSNRVLIGTGSGPAYLFNADGTLITTFTNPIPASVQFIPATSLGEDRVLFADFLQQAGIVYLFNVNGALLTTFTNPTPAQSYWFGYSVAAIGSDHVLISTQGDDTDATNAGAVYLFNTNGALLMTLRNPAASGEGDPFDTSDSFGFPVRAVGNDRVVIGAPTEDIGATNAGVVYLYSLVPSLGIRTTPTNTLAISWPAFEPDFKLQQNTNGIATANWSNVTGTIQSDGTNNYLTVESVIGNRFYRIIKP